MVDLLTALLGREIGRDRIELVHPWTALPLRIPPSVVRRPRIVVPSASRSCSRLSRNFSLTSPRRIPHPVGGNTRQHNESSRTTVPGRGRATDGTRGARTPQRGRDRRLVGRRRRCGAPGPGARGGARAPRPLGLGPRRAGRPVAPDAVATRRRGARHRRRRRARAARCRSAHAPTSTTRGPGSSTVRPPTTSTATTAARHAVRPPARPAALDDHDDRDALAASPIETAPHSRHRAPVAPPRRAPPSAPRRSSTRPPPAASRADPPHRRGDRAVARTPAGPTYTVAPGDCLWSIAARVLGRNATARAIDRGWRAIYAANRAAIGADPNLIHPGLVLTLPPLDPTP